MEPRQTIEMFLCCYKDERGHHWVSHVDEEKFCEFHHGVPCHVTGSFKRGFDLAKLAELLMLFDTRHYSWPPGTDPILPYIFECFMTPCDDDQLRAKHPSLGTWFIKSNGEFSIKTKLLMGELRPLLEHLAAFDLRAAML
jgi:hypothetical protein